MRRPLSCRDRPVVCPRKRQFAALVRPTALCQSHNEHNCSDSRRRACRAVALAKEDPVRMSLDQPTDLVDVRPREFTSLHDHRFCTALVHAVQ